MKILRDRIRALFRRDAVLHDIDEELRSHLEMESEANRELGIPDEEAARAARRAFGNLGRIRDLAYEVRGGGFMETLWQDLRYGTRLLLKHPGFTLAAVATLAIGIGANTAIFSIVNAVLLRPFPFPQPDRIVIVTEDAAGTVVSYPNFADWKDDRDIFASTSAVRGDESYNFSGGGEPERLQGRIVSAGFLSTLKVNPVLGHDFTPDDDRPGATPKVLLSHAFWNRRFNADPAIVSTPITLNNQSYIVAGVLPRDFQFGSNADVTIPIGLSADRFKA